LGSPPGWARRCRLLLEKSAPPYRAASRGGPRAASTDVVVRWASGGPCIARGWFAVRLVVVGLGGRAAALVGCHTVSAWQSSRAARQGVRFVGAIVPCLACGCQPPASARRCPPAPSRLPSCPPRSFLDTGRSQRLGTASLVLYALTRGCWPRHSVTRGYPFTPSASVAAWPGVAVDAGSAPRTAGDLPPPAPPSALGAARGMQFLGSYSLLVLALPV
jgi:hypothetical protein